jgi:hypothetical protein
MFISLLIAMLWFSVVVGAILVKRISTKTNIAIIYKRILCVEGVKLCP